VSLEPGSRIGPYEIVSQLGAGGMGEVYRARDSKLKRDVAIKVLHADVGGDEDRLARFQREAEVLASLNHPHIAQVYGFEDGPAEAGPHRIPCLVMELVEGEDLSQRIRRGPIPLDEALPIAKQIAMALEAAHEAGIVHRDLKPGNIKLREDGTVKVLDFGLAKALNQGSGIRDQGSGIDPANTPTVVGPAMTMRGAILGTPGYMSPEQAKGKPVDKRADIWAFGCVLYEMLAGRATFTGETTGEIMAAIVKSDPDWSAVDGVAPPRIRQLIERCLDKDPRTRLRDIGDARILFDADDRAAAPATAVVTTTLPAAPRRGQPQR
jgi:eukaryotic-like serine/threonine-protein kinase